MRRVEERQIVLSLNKLWQPIGVKTVKQAFTDMCGGGKEPPAFGLDIEYNQIDGEVDFDSVSSMRPVLWDEWRTLPIRSYDLVIHTSKYAVRVPTVIVSANYARMPDKDVKWSRDAVRARDRDTCQITGKKLKRGEGNLEHALPKSRGGKDTWENTYYIDKRLNFEKGNKTLEEMGWKLLKPLRAPNKVPVSATIRELKHRDWKHFLTHLEMEKM